MIFRRLPRPLSERESALPISLYFVRHQKKIRLPARVVANCRMFLLVCSSAKLKNFPIYLQKLRSLYPERIRGQVPACVIGSDFRLRQSFKIGQKQRPSLLVGKLGQSATDDCALLRLDGIRLRISPLFRRGATRFRRRPLAGIKLAQAVYRAAARERDQPRKGPPARLVKIRSLIPDLYEDIL